MVGLLLAAIALTVAWNGFLLYFALTVVSFFLRSGAAIR
jgi:hypothetical protein